MNLSGELAALVAAFVTSSFALVRFALGHNRALTERFVGFLEGAVRRQEEANDRFERALQSLSTSVRDNTAVLARAVEFGIRSPESRVRGAESRRRRRKASEGQGALPIEDAA